MSDPLKAIADRTPDTTAPAPEAQLSSASKSGDLNPGDANPGEHEDGQSIVIEKAPVNEAAKALALAIAEAADDRKAGNIAILKTGDVSYLADYFVIATGFSKVQVRAIANAIEEAVEDKFDTLPFRNEGMGEGRWVLKDYGDVIAHIFMPDDREYYDLEAFWGHAERVEFTPTPLA